MHTGSCELSITGLYLSALTASETDSMATREESIKAVEYFPSGNHWTEPGTVDFEIAGASESGEQPSNLATS